MLSMDHDRRRLFALAISGVAGSAGAAAAAGAAGAAGRAHDGPRPPARNTPSAADEPATAAAYVAPMRLGIQAGDYLEMAYEPAGLPNAVHAADFDNMRQNAGLDHLRIPANCAARADVRGVIAEAFLQKLDQQVDLALARFERVILDPLHHYNTWKGDHSHDIAHVDYQAVGMLTADQHAVRATAMWTQLATRYKDHSLRLSFDLFNEPASVPQQPPHPAGLTAAQLDSWHAAVIPAIRATGGRNAARMLWLEAWSNMLDLLAIPAGAGPVGVSPHYYSPFGFTHGNDVLRPAGMANFTEDIRYAQRWGAIHRVPIWIGEAGVSRNLSQGSAPRAPAERAEYIAHVRATCLQLGVPVCYWGYNSAFALYDQAAKAWAPDMLQALTGLPQPLFVRPVCDFSRISGGRMAREMWINGVWRGFAYDPATGVLTAPANDTGIDQHLSLVFPHIPVGGRQSWILRAAEFTGRWQIGVAPYIDRPDAPNQNGVQGLDVLAKNLLGQDIYPGWRPAAPGGYENAFGVISSSNPYLGASLIFEKGSPPGRLALSCLRSV